MRVLRLDYSIPMKQKDAFLTILIHPHRDSMVYHRFKKKTALNEILLVRFLVCFHFPVLDSSACQHDCTTFKDLNVHIVEVPTVLLKKINK